MNDFMNATIFSGDLAGKQRRQYRELLWLIIRLWWRISQPYSNYQQQIISHISKFSVLRFLTGTLLLYFICGWQVTRYYAHLLALKSPRHYKHHYRNS